MHARLSVLLVCLLVVYQGPSAMGQGRTSANTTVIASVTVDGGSEHPAEPTPEPEKPVRPRETGRAKEPDVLPTPMCFPRDFNSIVEKECGEKKSPVKFKNERPIRSRAQCEAEVTARELQKAIRHADQNCVAQILIQSRSVRGLEEGFRIPPELDFIQNFGFREKDPDVVAVKGLALGVLQGDTDRMLVTRLVEALVPSFTPRGGKKGREKKPEPKDEEHAPPAEGDDDDDDEDVEHLPSVEDDDDDDDDVEHLPPAEDDDDDGDDDEPATAGPTMVLCNVTVEEEKTNTTFVRSELSVCKEDKPEQPKMKKEPSMHGVDADRFERSLRDRPLLLRVFTADPNEMEKMYGKGGGRRLLNFPRRRLQCSSCMNADSYICAYCWEAEFCSQFYWCPEV